VRRREGTDASGSASSIRADAALVATNAAAILTTQQRASAQRELKRLLETLAEELATAAADAPHLGLKLYRAPGWCVMQGDVGALSVSWFPRQFEETSIGDLQVIEWRGIVSLPGARRRAEGGATVVEARVFHPVCTAASQWGWQMVDGERIYTTDDLVLRCLTRLPLQGGCGAAQATRG
jgi:hypothetical protein